MGIYVRKLYVASIGSWERLQRWLAGIMHRCAFCPLVLAGAFLLGCSESDFATRATEAKVVTWLPGELVFEAAGVPVGSDSIFFFGVQHGLLTPEGTSVIGVNGSRPAIVYLDSLGALTAVVGRRGAGPGEFMFIGGVFPSDSAVAAWDMRNQRVTFLTQTAVEDVKLTLPTTQVVVGILEGGTIVSAADATMGPLFGGILVGNPTRYHIWDRTGGLSGVLNGPPVLEVPSFVTETTGDRTPDRVITGTCLPRLLHSVSRGRFLIADASVGTVYYLSQSGHTSEIYKNEQIRLVTEETERGAKEIIERAEGFRGGRITAASERRILAQIGEVGSPLPSVWSAFLTDIDSNLWLRRVTSNCFYPERDAIAEWEVLDPDGKFMARAQIPSKMHLLAVGRGRVLVKQTDELGVERLGVYLLTASEP